MRHGRLVLWLLVLVLGVACASPDLPVEQRPRVLLLPANFDYKTPDALLPGLEVVSAAVERYVTDEGIVCIRVDLATVTEQWEPSIQTVGGLIADDGSFDPKRLEAARGELVRRLVLQREAEGALVPTVELKKASYNNKGTKAVWDGVRLSPRVVGPARVHTRRQLAFKGRTQVTSLWVSLYDPAGELVDSRRGGLELVQRMEIRRRKQQVGRDTYYYQWVDRDDLFQDEARIESALDLAVDPLFDAIPATR